MIELNKIYCENCLDTMARMPDEFIDLTVTSPPYDGLRDYNGYEFDFEKIAKELFRVTKKGGVVVWVVGDETKNGCESLTSFKQAIYFVEQCGFNLHDTMIYKKKNPLPTNDRKRLISSFEYMFVLSSGNLNTFNPLIENCAQYHLEWNSDKSYRRTRKGEKRLILNDKNKTRCAFNVREYVIGRRGSEEAINHDAVFPEILAKENVLLWSNEGDLIFDPFMGSGTTAKMAHILKRCWIGSEISQEYVDIANKRLEKYLRQEVLDL